MSKVYLDELVQKITSEFDSKGFDELDASFKKANRNSSNFRLRIERDTKRASEAVALLGKSLRRALGLFWGVQGIRNVIQVTRDLDLLQHSIKGITKSTQDWEYLRKEADRTGTSFKTLAQSYKNFYSSANMAGFNKSQIQSMFSDVLTAGRGAGIDQQQIGRALLAMEQMFSKGKVSMEELRRQLGNAMPGAFELAAKAMGVTTAQLNELVKKGLDAKVLLPKLTKEMKNCYSEAYFKNIHTLDAEIWRLNNAWLEFQANILHGEAGEALAQLVREITAILKNQDLLNFIQLIGKGLAFVIKHIKTILALWGFNKFMKLIMLFDRGQHSLKSMGLIMRLLSLDVTHLGRSMKVLAGAKGIGAAIRASTLLYGKWLLILGVILLLQDIIMGIFDKNSDTLYNDLMRKKPNNPVIVPGSENSIGGPVWADPSAGFNVREYITEGADPINTNLQIPNSGYVGTLPNLNGNYNSAENRKIENNISINISAPNSQPDTIALSIEDTLKKFFTNYETSFA